MRATAPGADNSRDPGEPVTDHLSCESQPVSGEEVTTLFPGARIGRRLGLLRAVLLAVLTPLAKIRRMVEPESHDPFASYSLPSTGVPQNLSTTLAKQSGAEARRGTGRSPACPLP